MLVEAVGRCSQIGAAVLQEAEDETNRAVSQH
jgi:hypothetical protein